VQDLVYKAENSFVVVYFYFSFSDEEKQTFGNMLRSIIAQLLDAIPGTALPQEVLELYMRYGKRERTPDIDTLKTTVEHMMRRFERVFIVIDALDESDKDTRSDLLIWITQVQGNGRSILATSRDEHDIRRILTPNNVHRIPIQSSEVDSDVSLYVQNYLQREPALKRLPVEVRGEIEDRLVSGSRGMYEPPKLNGFYDVVLTLV
jgi:ankyrin repeat domain-containing protein 50